VCGFVSDVLVLRSLHNNKYMSNFYWFRFILAELRRPFIIYQTQQRKQHTLKIPSPWSSKITSLLLLQQVVVGVVPFNLRVLLLLSTSTTTTFTAKTASRMSISSLSSSLAAAAALSSSLSSSWNPPTHIEDLPADMIRRFVPPLSADTSYKGSSGRVGVLGGSERYTGAPYYAAMSSLTVGADLAYVFCAKEAAIPIKCYSPELMVSPVYSAEEFDKAANENSGSTITPNHPLVRSMVTQVTSMLHRLHVLIIGPGLGRCPLVMCATAEIIRQAISYPSSIPLVLDADALFLLTQTPYKDLLLVPEDMQRTIVLTPNAVELKRLKQAIDECTEGEEKFRIQQSYRGVIVVQKGRYDTIFFASSLFHNNSSAMPPAENADDKTMSLVCKEQGGLKRSGGLGDILSGSIGTFLAWDRLLTETKSSTTTTTQDPSTATTTSQAMLPLLQGIEQQRLVPCWLACCIVKRATKVAYDKKRRAMTAPNVLNEIGTVVDEIITSAFDRL